MSDGEEVGYKSALQRIGDNNKLWIFALVMLLVISAFLIRQAGQAKKTTDKQVTPPKARLQGDYRDQDHNGFIREFIQEKGKDGSILEAGFKNNQTFAFTVRGETGADDIEYLSKMAAELHRARFRNWATIEAYQKSAATGRKILRARTTWVKKQYGFVVKFVDNAK